jgi:hypothetical protein
MPHNPVKPVNVDGISTSDPLMSPLCLGRRRARRGVERLRAEFDQAADFLSDGSEQVYAGVVLRISGDYRTSEDRGIGLCRRGNDDRAGSNDGEGCQNKANTSGDGHEWTFLHVIVLGKIRHGCE